ncbi:MAG: hypothetical protein ACI9AD_001747 [Nitriliruptoraceae bacterium]|jgi:hypothetical protein
MHLGVGSNGARRVEPTIPALELPRAHRANPVCSAPRTVRNPQPYSGRTVTRGVAGQIVGGSSKVLIIDGVKRTT